jgi:hypothetical protein
MQDVHLKLNHISRKRYHIKCGTSQYNIDLTKMYHTCFKYFSVRGIFNRIQANNHLSIPTLFSVEQLCQKVNVV